jgi:hypothetical protein
VVRALGCNVGDGDFFDGRLVDEIVDCAVAHTAGAENKYSHAGRMVIYAAHGRRRTGGQCSGGG